jgi:two-component system, NarL family, response regulator LiaR
MEITIILADDHKIVREGTRQLLEQDRQFKILAEAANGAEAVDLIARLHPQIVVMDVRMPVLGGIQATRAIKVLAPQTHILILSAYDDDQYVFPLLEAGASGYLLKTASGKELADAILTIHGGGIALSPEIARKVVERLTGRQPQNLHHHNSEAREGLTEREIEVLYTAAQGKSNKAIALLLGISDQTVQVHLRNIFNKLEVNSRSEAVAHAIGRGWFTLEARDE